MAIDVYYANSPKRRNSTKQATFSESNKYSCVMKDNTSLDHPTFLFEGNWIGWNVAKWGDRYYFVDDVRVVRNGLWEVDCVLDVLATYKSAITSSTQYVAYSSNASDNWLPDTRIPMKVSYEENTTSHSLSSLIVPNQGFYVLSVLGKNGCVNYVCTLNNLKLLIAKCNDWFYDVSSKIIGGNYQGILENYDFTTIEGGIEAVAKMLTQSGTLGNAYGNAPSCIRSCKWVPFLPSSFQGAQQHIWLGDFDTNVVAYVLQTDPWVDGITLSIPWKYSDWRRSTCENLYLYLPFVGTINLSSESLCNYSSIKIRVTASALDGTVCYQVFDTAGQDPIGIYTGSCVADYPIGINQGASVADYLSTAFQQAEKMANCAIESSISPLSAGGSAAGIALTGIETGYKVMSLPFTKHPTVIGSASGAAASDLIQNIVLFAVSYDTACTPSAMAATMGRPMMKPTSLSSLTGYCQCVNAHISCDANATELNAIDMYLNSGFYIE